MDPQHWFRVSLMTCYNWRLMWMCLQVPTHMQKKTLKKTYFLLSSWKPLTKRAGSGSVIQCKDPRIRICSKCDWNTACTGIRLNRRLSKILLLFSICIIWFRTEQKRSGEQQRLQWQPVTRAENLRTRSAIFLSSLRVVKKMISSQNCTGTCCNRCSK